MNATYDKLQTLVLYPWSNYTAVAVAVAALVTCVLLVALIMIVLVLPGRAVRSTADETPSRRRLGCGGWILVAAICLVGLGFASALWYETTSSDAYCARTCHTMAKADLSWIQSPHSQVGCVTCHEGHLPEDIPSNAALRLQDLAFQLADKSSPPRPVPPSRCLSCHTSVLDAEMIARNGESFRHREVLADDGTCVRCHGAQGHAPARKAK